MCDRDVDVREPADLVLRGGRVVTADEGRPEAEIGQNAREHFRLSLVEGGVLDHDQFPFGLLGGKRCLECKPADLLRQLRAVVARG